MAKAKTGKNKCENCIKLEDGGYTIVSKALLWVLGGIIIMFLVGIFFVNQGYAELREKNRELSDRFAQSEWERLDAENKVKRLSASVDALQQENAFFQRDNRALENWVCDTLYAQWNTVWINGQQKCY